MGWWGEGKKKKKYILCNRILLKSYLPFLGKLKNSLLAANKHRHRILGGGAGTGLFLSHLWRHFGWVAAARKPALPSVPLPLCSLPSGYSRAQEFALPCGHPACCLVSVTQAQEETATCLPYQRSTLLWKGKPGKVSSRKRMALMQNRTAMLATALPEGSPGSPPGAEWRCPDEVSFAHRKNSNLSWCKLEQLLSGSDAKNHFADWIGMVNGLMPPSTLPGVTLYFAQS